MTRCRRAAATITGLGLGLVLLCGTPAARPDSAAEPLQELQNALDRGDFDSAAALYDNAYQRYPETVSARLRARLVRHAEAALDAGDARRAARLLLAYTDVYYQDGEALRLLAEAQRRLGRHALEIESVLLALDHVGDAALERSLEGALDAAVAARAQQLREAGDVEALVALYEGLVERRPAQGRYHLELARAYRALGRERDALAVLERARYLPQSAEPAQRLAGDIRADEPAAAASDIDLQRIGAHYAVTALLNDTVPAVLLIDTGASLTVIDPRLIRRAGATANAGSVTLQTAGGAIRAPLVRLRRLTVGDRSLTDLRVAALELPAAAGAAGLLGMDFLQHFGFEIDPARSVLLLTR